MGRVLIKEAPDVDFYVEYSTVAGAPIFAGTRAEMRAFLIAEQRDMGDHVVMFKPEGVARHLAKADETGSSQPDWEGAWDDSGTIMEQRGICPRARIGEFARRYLAGDKQRAYDLLEPFDDLDEVRRG